MKVLHFDQQPTRWPIAGTLTWYLALDYFGAPGWAWGVAGTCAAVVWIAVGIRVFKQKPTRIKELD